MLLMLGKKKIKKILKKKTLFDIYNEGKLGDTLPFRLHFLIEHLDSEQEQEQEQEERSGKKTLGGWHSLRLPPPWVQPIHFDAEIITIRVSRIFLNIFIRTVIDEVKNDFFSTFLLKNCLFRDFHIPFRNTYDIFDIGKKFAWAKEQRSHTYFRWANFTSIQQLTVVLG